MSGRQRIANRKGLDNNNLGVRGVEEGGGIVDWGVAHETPRDNGGVGATGQRAGTGIAGDKVACIE